LHIASSYPVPFQTSGPCHCCSPAVQASGAVIGEVTDEDMLFNQKYPEPATTSPLPYAYILITVLQYAGRIRSEPGIAIAPENNGGCESVNFSNIYWRINTVTVLA
jgi:hypothetical protein